jgi:hypothetical protein
MSDELELRAAAIARFLLDGCKPDCAEAWWESIDKATDEHGITNETIERLDQLHTDACRQAWDNLETAPTCEAWTDVCAITGVDICKNYNKKRK